MMVVHFGAGFYSINGNASETIRRMDRLSSIVWWGYWSSRWGYSCIVDVDFWRPTSSRILQFGADKMRLVSSSSSSWLRGGEGSRVAQWIVTVVVGCVDVRWDVWPGSGVVGLNRGELTTAAALLLPCKTCQNYLAADVSRGALYLFHKPTRSFAIFFANKYCFNKKLL